MADEWETAPAKDEWETAPASAKKTELKKDVSRAEMPKTAGEYAGAIGRGIRGLGDAALTMVSGGLTGMVAPVAGLVAGAAGMLSGDSPDMAAGGANAAMEDVQRMGTWKPRTPEGQTLMSGVGHVMESAKEKLGGLTDNPAGSAVLSAAPDAAMAALGVKGLRNVKGAVIPAKPLTQVQDAVAQAQRDGFMADPAKANPSMVNKGLETLAGSAGIKSRLAEKNVEHASRLVKEELGLAPGEFLNDAALTKIRTTAAQAYDKIKSINMDIPANEPRFQQALRNIDKQFESVKEFVPGLIDLRDMERVRGLAGNPQSPSHPGAWTPKSLLEVSQQLRAEATHVLDTAQSNKAAYKEASAMKAAATAMEDLIENALTPQGTQRVATGFNLVSDFRKARELIAKTYDVEAATNLTTGRVDPMKLAKILQNGGTLSGNLEKIGRAASSMPDVMRTADGHISKSDATMYLTDLGVGAAATAASHGLASPYMAAVAARPAARAMMASKPYQNVMAKTFNKPGRQYRMGEAGQATGAAATMAAPQQASQDEVPTD